MLVLVSYDTFSDTSSYLNITILEQIEPNTTYWVLVCSLLIEFLGIKVPVH